MKDCLGLDNFKSEESEAPQLITNTLDPSSSSNADKAESSPIHCLRNVWESHVASKNHAIFFCRLISRTVDVYFSKEYTFFDAHTTTNCCHGIALLARTLVLVLS